RADPIEEMFANEVGKTVELLDLLVHEYEVVVTNPPYLGSAKMGEALKSFISDNYLGSRDLYSSFIQRSWQFTTKDGYATLVTPENYMFIASFTKLRDKIIKDKQFLEGVHLSRYGFDQQKDAYTIPFVLRNTTPADEGSPSRFLRMTHEQPSYETYEQKIDGLNEITRTLRDNGHHSDEYIIDQNTLESVRRSPLVYWFGSELLGLFKSYTSLGEVSEISGGVKSGDNDHFLRKHWEVPKEEIGDKYNWFVSNGDYIDYYDRIDTVIDWEAGGENIKSYSEEHGTNYQGLSNTDWYFDEAVIYRKFSREFVAKYIPDGCIFSSGVYRVAPPEEVSLPILLGYMNSSLYRYLATGINPTLNFNPGDAGAAPFKTKFENGQEISELVRNAVEDRMEKFALVESGREFDPQKFYREHDSFSDYVRSILYDQERLEASIITQHSKLDELFFDEFKIGGESRDQIRSDLSPNFASHPVEVKKGKIAPGTDIPEYVPITEVGEARYDTILERITAGGEIAEDLETSPFTVVLAKKSENLYTSDEEVEIAERILSYLVGEYFGRWEAINGLSEGANEVLLLEDGPIKDIIQRSLGDTLQSSGGVMDQIANVLNEEPVSWMRDEFFSDHHCKEYRRRGQRNPIYWQLESPDGAFSCFIYYHEIDANTLPKLRGQYLDPRIDELKNEL
ncbi:MAG: Eco57I restriction-modification methylase domain-containing protein, partial [Halobacteriaceae archaeon]